MHLTYLLLTTSAALSSAQMILNTSTSQFDCPSTPPNAAYCTGPSLTSNIIVRCTGTEGVAGNCNDNLAGVPPIGVKDFAPCYESTPTAGDAACSYGGTVYPDQGNGSSFPVPGPRNDGNNTTATTAAAGGNNVSVSLMPGTSVSTSTIVTSSSPSIAPAVTALAGIVTPSAPYPYPIPSLSNNSTAASATGTGTGTGTGTPFTGAAGCSRMKAAAFADSVAKAVAFGGAMVFSFFQMW